ncbi:related to Pre-mRNA-processing factor 39 [Zygosaccharomyces bailii]|nr:related to Pre-mRNA-processing factor 39 [Zygosaccharomyces bailii ISA1307]SJM82493.1 related to Pre-mRNA-processing factor 39 [Zygosaccharomyces bailii]
MDFAKLDMQSLINVHVSSKDNSNALENLDPSFLRENPQLVNAYSTIKWDSIGSLNTLISIVEQLVVKYKDPNIAIKTAIEKIYCQLLERYPLFFGYWKRFTAVEYQLFGLKKSIDTLARAVQVFPTSLELWCDYLNVLCANSPTEVELIRKKFRMAKEKVGFQFLSHTFWDKYIDFETKHSHWHNLGSIYQELITIPLHQYAKYGGAYKAYLLSDNADVKDSNVDIKLKKTQKLVNAIWPYESKIKQNFFNLTPIAPEEIQNWEQYLDFLISSKNKFSREFVHSVFERCLIPCFYYEHCWIKYVNWCEEVYDWQVIVEMYQRGLSSLPTNCKTFRLKYLSFLKKNYRNKKDYVYTLYSQAVATYIKFWPSDTFLLKDYLAMFKRFYFSSMIEQDDETIFDQQKSYSAFLENALSKFLEGKIDKNIPLQDMVNDINVSIVVVELIKNTWLVLKNTIQTRKFFIAYSKNPLIKSSVTFWLTYYKFEKSLQNFTKLNKFVNDLGSVIFLPTAIVRDILDDYQNFFLLNASVADYQMFVPAIHTQKEIDPILLIGSKFNDPTWSPGQFQNISEWHKRREFRENGHPGVIEDRPRITNIILQQNSRWFSNCPPPLPAFSNLEKINQPLKYDDYMSQYLKFSK